MIRRATTTTLFALSIAVGGCSQKSADAPGETAAQKAAETKGAETKAAEKKAAPAKAAAEAPAAKAEAAKTPPAKTRKPTPDERKARMAIKWPGGVEWVDDWATARAQSAETGKPICLVVYADWCPRCKELAPMFAEADLVEVSRGLIMVRQDNDARPDWLQAYADQGSYVPRIFFFGKDGNLRTDITSGHPRYPFFYSSRQKSALVKSMKTATGA